MNFRTRYNCLIKEGEIFEPGTSLTEPGRSESLDHLVQRLTRKPNPTSKDLTRIAVATGQVFEDPTSLSEAELDDRFERVVTLGDNLDAAETLLDATEAFDVARAEASQKSESKRSKARVSSNDNQSAEAVPGASLATGAKETA